MLTPPSQILFSLFGSTRIWLKYDGRGFVSLIFAQVAPLSSERYTPPCAPCSISAYTNIVYALMEHGAQGGVYRSEDKGATWAKMSDTNPRPSYFSQIRVDPNNENKIWLGGVNIYLSQDGGRT